MRLKFTRFLEAPRALSPRILRPAPDGAKIRRSEFSSLHPRVNNPQDSRRRTKKKFLVWQESQDLGVRISGLVRGCNLEHIKRERVFTYRSVGAKTRAYARIWGLGRIFQQALQIEPAYVIEVISEKFDRLSHQQQDMVLIHELLHIPKTFSGALVPHKHKGGVNERTVRSLYNNLKRSL